MCGRYELPELRLVRGGLPVRERLPLWVEEIAMAAEAIEQAARKGKTAEYEETARESLRRISRGVMTILGQLESL